MLDQRAVLLPWVAQHTAIYGGLWILYFLSQMLLLPVPHALTQAIALDDQRGAALVRVCARIGYGAILLALVGLCIVYTSSLLIARAYIDEAVGVNAPTIVLLGDLFADIGKEIRLFSEVLLGIWLGTSGIVLLRYKQFRIESWIVCAVSAYTLVVALVKIANPLNPLEDTLGLFLAVSYVVIGIVLLRQSQNTLVDDRSDLPRLHEAEQFEPSGSPLVAE